MLDGEIKRELVKETVKPKKALELAITIESSFKIN